MKDEKKLVEEVLKEAIDYDNKWHPVRKDVVKICRKCIKIAIKKTRAECERECDRRMNTDMIWTTEQMHSQCASAYEDGLEDGRKETNIELINELEKLEKLRFVGDKLDQFERQIRNKISFPESKMLNIIYKEIWEYSHKIGEVREKLEEK